MGLEVETGVPLRGMASGKVSEGALCAAFNFLFLGWLQGYVCFMKIH